MAILAVSIPLSSQPLGKRKLMPLCVDDGAVGLALTVTGINAEDEGSNGGDAMAFVF